MPTDKIKPSKSFHLPPVFLDAPGWLGAEPRNRRRRPGTRLIWISRREIVDLPRKSPRYWFWGFSWDSDHALIEVRVR